MDSVSQIALGASVSELIMQNKVGRKATLWGAICGTLPDLDVLIPMGNAIKDFTYHRAESHAFFYMAIFTPLIVWLITKIHPETKAYKIRWMLLVFFSFITHTLLDSFTVYGTQLLLPFSDYPVGWSTIFVVDPLYTIPLILGLSALFLVKKDPKLGLKLNSAGLILASLYLAWSIGAKSYVSTVVEKSLQIQNISVSKTQIGPSPFNTFLWRIIAMTDNGYYEGVYSLFDKSDKLDFKYYPSENRLIKPITDDWNVKRLQWFTKGFYKVSLIENKIVITDLRMGVGSLYFFQFVVGKKEGNQIKLDEIIKLDPEPVSGFEPIIRIWQRIWNEEIKIL